MTSVISKIVKDERNRAGLHAEIAESDPIRGYVKDIKNSQKNGKIWINKVSVWY
jgi:hypothetical protein